MRRRNFIALLGSTTLAWPLFARAQQPQRVSRIGMMMAQFRREALQQALRDLGYVEGSNVEIEFRSNESPDRLDDFAAQLVSLRVDVIVAAGSQSVRAAQHATSTIPIIMAGVSDPVGTGFVVSLARPGGNITGISLQSPEVSGKRLELLKETVPGLSRVTVLLNPDDPPALIALKETELAAKMLAIASQAVEVRRPDNFDGAFASAATARSDALVILSAPIMYAHVERIAERALINRLPSIHIGREYPAAGGLMSYGPRFDNIPRSAAMYVDKILKGANPADLPVEQPTTFKLVINLKTAKALGLTVPQALLARADEVIE